MRFTRSPNSLTICVLVTLLLIYSDGILNATNADSENLNAAELQLVRDEQSAAPKQLRRKDALPNTKERASFKSIAKVAEIGEGLRITGVRLSSNGKKIFADGGYVKKSIIWEPSAAEGFRIIQCGRTVGDGDLCLTSPFDSSSPGLKAFETSTGKELFTLSKNTTDKVIVSPLSSFIAVKTVTDGITLFDVKSGQRIGFVASEWGFKDAMFSLDESVLAANDSDQFVVFDVKRSKGRKIDVTDVRSFAVSRNGAFLWAASGYARPQVLTAAGKRLTQDLASEFSSRYKGSVFGRFMDSDSKVVMKNVFDEVCIWDWKSNRIVELPTKADELAVAESGVLTVTKDGVMELWDRDAQKVFAFEGLMKLGVMSPDGDRIVTLSRKGALTLWDVSW